ncbi:MAG TPA: FAD-dependent monooxygenase, partial [Ktedonobacteraceae bacterium]|nr:FAD-dependent monooxygenase [Ktedonobacteraceae bacterium]
RAEQIDEFVPVVIVGGGPTGLAAGNLLGQAGIETLIIERNMSLSSSPKALSLDDEGLRICQAMGLSDVINKLLLSDVSAHYVSAGRVFLKVAPTRKRNGYPLISTFYQPEFETALLHGLQRFPCVQVRFQYTVEALEQTDSGVIISLRTPTGTYLKVGCNYLLACDGGNSAIRHLLGIPMEGVTYEQKWLVVDCFSDEDASMVATCFCNPARPSVTIPAPHNVRRWEFMLLPGETEKELLRSENISALIQQAGGSPGSQIIRQAVYLFHSKLARTFSHGRIFLLGDAAHMMPPFGGQGLNCGLRDAQNLAWKLTMVLQGRAAPQLLRTYHEERHRHAAQMIHFSSLLASLTVSRKRSIAFCRTILFLGINALPPVRDLFTEARLKPQPKYKQGFFLFKSNSLDRSMTGLLLPQPEVTTQQGQRILLDEALGTGFALLRIHHNPHEAFAGLHADFWREMGVRFVCIQVDNHHQNGKTSPQQPIHPDYPSTTFEETTQTEQPPYVVIRSNAPDFLRLSQDQFIVVRPDRFILGAFKENNADKFVSAFQRMLQCSP